MSETGGNKTSMGLEQNIAALLCYLGWWITGIIFFMMEKENKLVKFHAMQSIIAFGVISIVMAVVSPILVVIPLIGWTILNILGIAIAILWIVCMLKAYQGQKFKLPVAGDIAEKQVK